jgi:hypothetical protein
LRRHSKELPRAFHNALLELNARTNSDERFRNLLRPTLNGVKGMVEDSIQREVDTLLDSYGTEHWDDRDVTYDNLIWGTSGIEVPIKRILYQVELVMQDSVSQFMPQMADVVANELERTLEAHEILTRLERASYERAYTYTLPGTTDSALPLTEAYETLIDRVGANFRQMCEQATMYELMKPNRSINYRLETAEQELVLPTNERLLDAALNGADSVRREILASMPAQSETAAAAPAEEEATVEESEFEINILDAPAEPPEELGISISGEAPAAETADLEMSYAEKLDNIAVKINQLFGEIVDDLFRDDELLPRLRRLFWLEATKAERDFTNRLIKPMLKQHDRNLQDETLRQAMEVDLESVSDLEELMRIWEGLHRLETNLSV